MTAMPTLTPEVLPWGLDGLLVRFALTPEPAAMAAARRLATRLESSPPEGTTEIAAALVSVLVRVDPETADRAASLANAGLCGLSIGFRARLWKPRPDRGRDLISVELVEISLVAAPMQPLARFRQIGKAARAA